VDKGLQRMSLDQWRTQQGWTWERLARELTTKCREYGEEPLYSNRLWRIRQGLTAARDYELRALLELTDYEVESYKDE